MGVSDGWGHGLVERKSPSEEPGCTNGSQQTGQGGLLPALVSLISAFASGFWSLTIF